MFTRPVPTPEKHLAWPGGSCRSAYRAVGGSARRVTAVVPAWRPARLIALSLRTTSAVIAFSPFGIDSYLRVCPIRRTICLPRSFLEVIGGAAGAILGFDLVAEHLDLTGQLGSCEATGRWCQSNDCFGYPAHPRLIEIDPT